MSSGDALDRGRDAFKRQAWGRAVAELTAADRNGSLGLDDLERLARAAYLAGKDERSIEVWTRAHHESIRLGDPARAAASALWIAFVLTHKGDVAHGGGWVARAQRLLDDGPLDCVEQGYLLVFAAMRSVFAGDAETACSTFREAGRIGERFGDTDLMTFARVGEGRTLIYLGRIAEGMAMLDEAMVAVTAGEVSPIVAGDVYCSVIEACQELFDLRRAQEWTAALGHWCDAQQDLVLYRGQCLVHRVEIMQLHGAWPDAIAEAQRAFERFADPPGQPAVGAAYYQRAELHRLRGEFDEAEEAYRLATEWGRNPQPGLALLRLAQGQLSAAEAAIRRELDEAQDPITRPKLLPAFVQIVLVANDVAEARAAAEELSGFAANLDAPYLHAVAAHATGAVVLAEGDARAALDPLRRALTGWRDLEAPYEAARVRMLIGLACRALGDEDTATMELNAARSVFEQLGAEPDLARVEEVPATRTEAGGLTGREVEVMRLVAAGKTNRAIAGELFISEKTVARHLSNIFVKLGVSSRTAAAAYAYEHDLV